MFLGQVVAAAVRQDAKAVEELTSQADPNEQLRNLVAKAQQGEPLRELEPDESTLRAAAAARKACRFMQRDQPKAETISKMHRPLPQLLCEELPKLWAAALEGRVAWGPPLNWVGQVAQAANDKAISNASQAEHAAALYGLRLMHGAYTASNRGADDTEGRTNVSTILGEMDWALVQRCQSEVSAESKGSTASSDPSSQACMRFLFGRCDGCRFRHGCSFLHHGRSGGTTLLRCPSAEVQLGAGGWMHQQRPVQGRHRGLARIPLPRSSRMGPRAR